MLADVPAKCSSRHPRTPAGRPVAGTFSRNAASINFSFAEPLQSHAGVRSNARDDKQNGVRPGQLCTGSMTRRHLMTEALAQATD